MAIDLVFASGAVVGRATTNEWGRPSLRAQCVAGRPNEARPTTAPDAKIWSIPTIFWATIRHLMEFVHYEKHKCHSACTIVPTGVDVTYVKWQFGAAAPIRTNPYSMLQSCVCPKTRYASRLWGNLIEPYSLYGLNYTACRCYINQLATDFDSLKQQWTKNIHIYKMKFLPLLYFFCFSLSCVCYLFHPMHVYNVQWKGRIIIADPALWHCTISLLSTCITMMQVTCTCVNYIIGIIVIVIVVVVVVVIIIIVIIIIIIIIVIIIIIIIIIILLLLLLLLFSLFSL